MLVPHTQWFSYGMMFNVGKVRDTTFLGLFSCCELPQVIKCLLEDLHQLCGTSNLEEKCVYIWLWKNKLVHLPLEMEGVYILRRHFAKYFYNNFLVLRCVMTVTIPCVEFLELNCYYAVVLKVVLGMAS